MAKMNKTDEDASLFDKDENRFVGTRENYKMVGDKYCADCYVETYDNTASPLKSFKESVDNNMNEVEDCAVFIGFRKKDEKKKHVRPLVSVLNVDGIYSGAVANVAGQVCACIPMRQLCSLERYDLAAKMMDKVMNEFQKGLIDSIDEKEMHYVLSAWKKLHKNDLDMKA